MTLNDLEPSKYGVLVILAILGCNTHFKSEFAETIEDRPGQPAYEIKLMLSRVP